MTYNIINKIKTQKMYLSFIFIVTLLQLPSFYETFWHVDDAIYASVAKGMVEGKTLYSEAWDHKPPFIYLLFWPFGFFEPFTALTVVRFFKTVFILISFTLLYKLINMLTKSRIRRIGLYSLSAFLLASPLLEANFVNAEILFVTVNLSILYLLITKSRHQFFIGFLLFMSFSIKFHGFLEALVLLGTIFSIRLFYEKKKIKDITIQLLKIGAGFGISLGIMILIFVISNNLEEAFDAMFIQNFLYAKKYTDNFIKDYFNLILLTLLAIFLIYNTSLLYFKQVSWKTYLILNIIFTELSLALLGGRNFTHYYIQLIPGLVLSLTIIRFPKFRPFNSNNFLLISPLITFAAGTIILSQTLKAPLELFSVGNYYTSFVTSIVEYGDTRNFNINKGGKALPIAEELSKMLNDGDRVYFHTFPIWINILVDKEIIVTNKYIASFHVHFGEKVVNEMVDAMKSSNFVVITQLKYHNADAIDDFLSEQSIYFESELYKVYQISQAE